MSSSPHRLSRPGAPNARAFSLVEVVIAVGIVSFAFVAILGLIPAGLSQFRQAMDTSVCAQIGQRVIMDAQQTDYEALTAQATRDANGNLTQNEAINAPLRYFDEQGNEVVSASATPSILSGLGVIYHANTRIIVTTDIPAAGYTGLDSQSIVTVSVEVAFNPSNKLLPIDTSSAIDQTSVKRKLFDRSQIPAVPIKTYGAQISRNE